jgi:Zn-dependent M28 family amino/carboxypeptidase
MNTPKNAKTETNKVTPSEKINIPDFNADSAYQFIENQLSFGPRVPESKAHKLCGEYLEKSLKRFTPHVFRQDFKTRLADKSIVNGSNFIASFQAEKKNRILLCAHWDSRPFADKDQDESKHNSPIDGANDGASGVGVLLEIARLLSIQNTNVGIDIIFFDLEDSGTYGNNDSWALGSQYWARNPHIPNYRARYGILLDMVGASNPYFSKESTSLEYAPDILTKVWATAKRIGYQDYFVDTRTGGILDDHVYINQILGIPTIDIIHYNDRTSTGFFEHWHTTKDDLNAIDKHSLKIVGHTVTTVIYEE